MKTVCWMLIVALFMCGAYLAIPGHRAPVMRMISNPNCFPPGTEGVGEGFAMCRGDVYRAETFENT